MLLCNEGTCQGSVEQTSCVSCAIGTYSDVTGLSSCVTCKAGKSQPSESSTGCVDYSAGSFQSKNWTRLPATTVKDFSSVANPRAKSAWPARSSSPSRVKQGVFRVLPILSPPRLSPPASVVQAIMRSVSEIYSCFLNSTAHRMTSIKPCLLTVIMRRLMLRGNSTSGARRVPKVTVSCQEPPLRV
jgi:hypothetical protein